MKSAIAFQRIEAATILLASIYFYYRLDLNFLWFALLLFTIDIFMLGYLVDIKIGAYVYNIGHSLSIPLLLLVAGILTTNEALLGLGLIWLAHVGLDRALGYGLKSTSGFHDTHLGRIGSQ